MWFIGCLRRKLIEKASDQHQVVPFSNGLDAFDYLMLNFEKPHLLPELIFLDINMPLMNGWEFLKSLSLVRPAYYHPRIYLVSSSTDEKDIDQAEQFTELSGFIQKPVSGKQMVHILESFPGKVTN